MLALTGERTLPGIPTENYWFRRHEAAYNTLVPFCPGAVVLEAGCGEGYGADRIAEVARLVVGVDYDGAAVGHVAATYPRVTPVRANLAALPVGDGVVDVVASLQVIEHIWDQPGFLAECRRVLRPAGTLLVTTPNRLTFTLPNRPMNPFHYRELDPYELGTLLDQAGFEISRLIGLRHGPRLRRYDRLFGSLVDAQLAGPPETWHRQLHRAVTAVRTTDFVLAADNLESSLDLVAVAVRRAVSEREGTFCLVLHTHLPWVAHAGAWPVGEEWLHQAFTGSWRRVLALLDRLAADGARDVLTLGVTPVLAAMLDDPYCLRELHTWAGTWQLRAVEAAARMPELARYEFRAATECLADLEGRWLTGGLSAVLRPLVDAGVVELLGGPATHPFLPLLDPRVAAGALAVGLDDTRLRLGRAPAGIWVPECGHAPGQEDLYAAAGVERFLVDSPALHGDTATARPVGAGPLLCFGRDLEVTYRVWSPRAGYPGAPDYRDFHTFDHASGFRPARVTGRHVPPERKKPWEPDLAAAAVRRDAADFVDTVLARLRRLADRDGRPGLVVAAFDTELFGHWWHEGPAWLATVLRELPAAGVRVTTLRGAVEAGHVGPPVTLGRSSWGSGKDWRVWEGPAVQDLVLAAKGVQHRLLSTLDARRGPARDPVLDQLAREALLALSSDWAFMVSHDTAAGYARDRAATHAGRMHELADRLDAGDRAGAVALADRLRVLDGPFGHLDARVF